MSTHSLICRQISKSTIKYVYCHFDGYIRHNGKILDRHYQDVNKIDELLSLGCLTNLGTKIGEKHDPRNKLFESFFCPPEQRDNPCCFSVRDEKEKESKENQAQTVSLKDFEKVTKTSAGNEYVYLYKNGQWYVSIYGAKMVLLSEAIKINEAAI